MGRDFIVSSNDLLATVSGFGSLARIGRDLTITDNAVLATISGFTALTSLADNLTVRDNPQLASCCGLLRLVDNTVQPGGTTTISGNATGCESGDAIEAACDTTTPTPVLGLPAVGEGLRFYPNPAFNTLYVEGITQETSLLIRTFSGRTLLRSTLHQDEAVDIAVLPTGVYLLTFQGGQESGQESSQESSQESGQESSQESSQESGQERFTRRLVIGF